MSKRPSTKRDLAAQIRALREPPAMSLEQALSMPDPVGEIAMRLSGKSPSSMSEPEKVFWAVAYFVGDTMNGGLDQSLANETGELMPLFAEFARRYGSSELVAVAGQISALFPSSQVPADPEERHRVISGLDPATLERLDEMLYGCESSIKEGLIALATKNAAQFDLTGKT